MKLSTDSVILGIWTSFLGDGHILDIGTGCGILSLISAQRNAPCNIIAIDIHQPSVMAAHQNFAQSPWLKYMDAFHISLQEFAVCSPKRFDRIISNPPFYSGSLLSEDPLRNLSRHTVSLSHTDLLSGISILLHVKGTCSLILDSTSMATVMELAPAYGLYPFRQLQVFPKEGKPAVRYCCEFSREERRSLMIESLVIRSYDGSFTPQYREFTKDYYLWADAGRD